ncbi:DUF4089 domain-containing protein [Methylobacterium sp. NEAU 140]|uniref:DUF4089 domain-containing protein n=1 Tax=Methylobacterium sp. NEAU 140 TaxID=3064945 RepID=UPI002735994F|nr:DUF4089 domain-containing protein [Methylobacterium sp. NEAU 140]MDP4027237.1 DUF4089 domain-containing protein [Methylobacterium sp. NEAU 140]
MPDLTPLAPLPDDAALDAVVDAMLPLLGLAAEPGWRGPILQNFRMVSGAARLVLEFPLPDELEPAPRFEP